jgi:hypothetical protein
VKAARVEPRNRVQAELLSAVLERIDGDRQWPRT